MSKIFKIQFSKMKPVFSVFLLILFSIFHCKSENLEKENTDNNPYEFHIGGVLSSNASEDYFKQTIEVMYNLYIYNMLVAYK